MTSPFPRQTIQYCNNVCGYGWEKDGIYKPFGTFSYRLSSLNYYFLMLLNSLQLEYTIRLTFIVWLLLSPIHYPSLWPVSPSLPLPPPFHHPLPLWWYVMLFRSKRFTPRFRLNGLILDEMWASLGCNIGLSFGPLALNFITLILGLCARQNLSHFGLI